MKGKPVIMDHQFNDDESFLNQIKSMKRGKPLSYGQAHEMYWEDVFGNYEAETPEKIIGDIIRWLEVNGYHIELTGAEYEICSVDYETNILRL